MVIEICSSKVRMGWQKEGIHRIRLVTDLQ